MNETTFGSGWLPVLVILLVLFGMGGRVVQCEQRIKVFQRLLGHITAHFLGFVQNDDGAVCGNDINGSTGAEFIALGIDDSGFLTLAVFLQRRSKSLRVDNHHIDAGTGREIVQLVQIGTVVDKEPGLLAVMLHEVIGSNLKGFLDAFTDGNTGHHNDKLAPAVALVQLEHGLDVHIGLAGTGFHLNIQRTSTQIFYKTGGHLDVLLVLQLLNVL